MTAAYLAAWLLALVPGLCVVLALVPPRTPGRVATGLGYGVVLGMLGCAGASALAARADTTNAWLHAAPWLGAFALFAAAAAVLRQRRTPPRAGESWNKVEVWKIVIVLVALASLLWRAWLMADEVALRPTYPWDAWDAWAVKSKTWFLLGHYAPFVPTGQWLRSASVDLYSGPAWAYPATLGWLQVWFASAAGGWIEPLVNMPWFALWVGLLLGHYGQWRALGLDRLRAAVGVYALGSLPLLASHVALAGYADLWIATLFGFAVLCWMRWQQRREYDQLALALLCAATLPLIKLEGMVWCVALLAAIGFGALPARWRWRAAGALLALVLVLALVGEAQLLFAAIGWVRSGSRVVDIPVIGKLALAWHGPAALGIVHSLFTQLNWHLLWWLVPLVLVARWRIFVQVESVRLLGLLLLVCFALLLFLFVFTDAAEWAESYTAVNRLIMHITPAVVSLLVLVMREPQPDRGCAGTTPAPGPPNGPA